MGFVDLRYGLDTGIDDSEAEGRPKCKGYDDGLGEQHMERANGGRIEERFQWRGACWYREHLGDCASALFE